MTDSFESLNSLGRYGVVVRFGFSIGQHLQGSQMDYVILDIIPWIGVSEHLPETMGSHQERGLL